VPFQEGDPEERDLYALYWNKGILLEVETYRRWVENDGILEFRGGSLNRAKAWFFRRPNSREAVHFQCSGGVTKSESRRLQEAEVKYGSWIEIWDAIDAGEMMAPTWCGDKDLREFPRYWLRKLRRENQILEVWPQIPWLWLLNGRETSEFELLREGREMFLRQCNERKLMALPLAIREAIMGGGWDH